MQFKDVLGQPTAKKGLLTLFHSQKLPHALLFSGREGTGGLPLAIAFAQFLLCNDRQEQDSCGHCPSCVKIARLAHPDLHLSFPAISAKPGEKPLSRYFMAEFREFMLHNPYGTTFDWLQFLGAENKQGNIPAEECREIIDGLNLKSFEGGYKVQIIWRPEYLGKEGNILLKLIEEPPADTAIILVAEEPEAILNTILSRTQLIQLAPLSVSDITRALIAQNTDERKAAQVAQMAEGSYAKALELFHQDDSDQLTSLRNWFNAIFAHKGVELIKWIEDFTKTGREQQKNFLTYVQQLLGNVLRLSLIPGYSAPLHTDELQLAQKLAGMLLSAETLQKMDKAIGQTIYYIERNANVKVVTLNLSIELQYLIKGQELKAFA